MILRHSVAPNSDPEISWRLNDPDPARERARVVFPDPGGPQRIIEEPVWRRTGRRPDFPSRWEGPAKWTFGRMHVSTRTDVLIDGAEKEPAYALIERIGLDAFGKWL